MDTRNLAPTSCRAGSHSPGAKTSSENEYSAGVKGTLQIRPPCGGKVTSEDPLALSGVRGSPTDKFANGKSYLDRKFLTLPRPSDMPSAQPHKLKYTGNYKNKTSRVG